MTDKAYSPPELLLLDYATESAARSVQQGDYATANRLLRKAAALHPDYIPARILLGKVHARQGRYAEAITEWEAVLETEPENREARNGILAAERMQALGYKGLLSSAPRLLALAVLMFAASLFLGGRSFIKQPSPMPVSPSEASKNPEEPRPQTAQVIKVERLEVANWVGATPNPINTIDLAEVAKVKANSSEVSFLPLEFRASGDTLFVIGKIPTLHLQRKTLDMLKSIPSIRGIDTTAVEITGRYEVQKTETLSSISARLYGTTSRVGQIIKINRRLLPKPTMADRGLTLLVPLR